MKKAVIFSPFWRTPNHVGNYRVDRFIRWLASDGYYIVLVRAGSSDDKREEPWGIEITVRDPLGIYKDTKEGAGHVDMRKPNRFRRMAAYLLFNPDPGVLWARSASKHPDVMNGSTGATFVISSSPPESAHVGAYILAKKIDSKLVIDMRDGWPDEPLKPDYVASVTDLPFQDNSFDTVVCFQVLEHLPFDCFSQALKELSRVSKNKVVVSLPDAKSLLRFSFYIPKKGIVKLDISRPRIRPQKHVFDGEHYWEINKLGFPLSRIVEEIKNCGITIDNTYRVEEFTYHRFFVLTKQSPSLC